MLSSKGGVYLLVSSMPEQVCVPTLQNLAQAAMWEISAHQIRNAAADLSLTVYVLKKRGAISKGSNDVSGDAVCSIASPGAPNVPMTDGLPFSSAMLKNAIKILRAQELKDGGDPASRRDMTAEEIPFFGFGGTR